jgi:biofilm PGA synthesis N-glycosyltransferase PgaC
MTLHVTFWLCLLAMFYAYVGYPCLAWLVARMKREQPPFEPSSAQPVSLIMSVFNEEHRIADRARELTGLLDQHHPESELIVVSDGSTDGTVACLRELQLPNVRLIEQDRNRGKAAALNAGVARAAHEILLFADVRQTWDSKAIHYLAGRFADQSIAGVSGDLELHTQSGELASVGVYWRLEKRLRQWESRWRSSIGVTGAIAAARRTVFPVLPAGIVLDDVYWPMHLALHGWRVVHEPRAKAYDQLPPKLSGEYGRKLRTLAGNFQLIAAMPGLLLPGRNPVWLQFVSHKLLRLLVPWLFLVCLVIAVQLSSHPGYALFALCQAAGLTVGALALASGLSRKSRVLGMMATLCALNFAAWLAFWVWLFGRSKGAWARTEYAAQ